MGTSLTKFCNDIGTKISRPTHDQRTDRWEYTDLRKWIKHKCNKKQALKVKKLSISFSKEKYASFKCIPNEIEKLTELKQFDCYHNDLTMLPDNIGKLVKLEKLICMYNKLKTLPASINNLTNLITIMINSNELTNLDEMFENNVQYDHLKIFWCQNNKLTSLPNGMMNIKNLMELDCSHNQITILPQSISNLINLTKFDCSYNKLTSLPNDISNLTSLQEFKCNNNALIVLPDDITRFVNLKRFNCENNKLIILPDNIGNLTNLEEFCCYNNKLTTFPQSIINLTNLGRLMYHDNEFLPFPPNIARFVEIFIGYHYAYRPRNNAEIYNDKQSVHNHNIQKCVTKSIQYILTKNNEFSVPKLREHIVQNDLLTDLTKQLLLEYCNNDDVHILLLIKFEELLQYVYTFINNHQCKKELFKVLNNEMSDSSQKCFTGRLSRLINVLNGFDENIVVNISDAEQIGNICILVKKKLEQAGEYTDDKYKEILTKELVERGYGNDIIDEWIKNI